MFFFCASRHFDVLFSLKVDLRASVGLEGYRRNIGDEIGARCVVAAFLLCWRSFCFALLHRSWLIV
jgi:hypothetical protein